MKGGTYSEAVKSGFTGEQAGFLARFGVEIKDEAVERMKEDKKGAKYMIPFKNFFTWFNLGYWQCILGVVLGAIFMTLLLGRAEAFVIDCKELNNFNRSQVYNLYKSYERGVQDDLGYTLAAIAWRESSAGKYRVNYNSKDYGLYGISVHTIQRLEDTNNYYKTVEHIQEVVHNDEKGAQYALETLRWNLKYHQGNWRKAVMHYNAGNKWWLGKDYIKDISLKVQFLKTCLEV